MDFDLARFTHRPLNLDRRDLAALTARLFDCGNIAFVSKKADPIKASYGCETADDSQAAHRHEAPYEREGTVGCESANGFKAFKCVQAKPE